ncbi:MAG: hypothetical protein IJ723_00770, partial [Ruminococcus sp.]|nr:hypothetical protein [Ruminococcus sp.]
MKKRIAAGLIGAVTMLSAAVAPAAQVITSYADDIYSLDFTIGGSKYVEQEIEKKYGADGLAVYRSVVEQLAQYAYNGEDAVYSTKYSRYEINVTIDRSIKLEYTQGSAIVGYVLKNNPQFYWVGNAWSVGAWRPYGDTDYYIGSAGIAVIDEFVDGSARRETSAQLAEKLNEYHALIETKENTFEKLKAVNDKIDADTEYVSADDISHRSIGCLLRRECVCEGYSKAFQLICNREGLGDNVFVEGIGYSDRRESGSEAHGWNLIQFDGAWYFVDSTWNDIILTDQYGNRLDNSSLWHTYFMRGSAFMENDHDVLPHLYASTATEDSMKYIEYPAASPVDLKAYLYADNMTLGEGMEYTLYCAAAEDDVYNDADFSLYVTVDGEEQVVAGVKKKVGDRDLVAFTMDVPVKNVGDSISATLTVQDSEDTFSADYSVSPKDYLTRLYAGSEGSTSRLAAAALNYAAAAQTYKGYNTTDLANSELSADERTVEAVTPDKFAGSYSYNDAANGVSLRSVSLDMMSKTRIRVYFTLGDSYSASYTDGTGRAEAMVVGTDGVSQKILINSAYEKLGKCGRDGELYWIETAGISPVSYSVPVSVEITADGETSSDSLSYSVYDYFRSKCTA